MTPDLLRLATRWISFRAPLLGSCLLVLALIFVAAPLGGCPGEEDQCRDYTPPASFDPNIPVGMQRDVVPIFQACSFVSCHGSTGEANGVYLGGTTAAALRAALVDVPSGELPSMPFVKPGDPQNSWLMRKLDGSHCTFDAQCKNGDCGATMPNGSEPLSVETRDRVRRWIAQGAQEN